MTPALIALTALVLVLQAAVVWLCIDRDRLARRIAALEAKPSTDSPPSVRFAGGEHPPEVGQLAQPEALTAGRYLPDGSSPSWLPGEDYHRPSGTGVGCGARGYL